MLCLRMPEELRTILSRAHEYFDMYLITGKPKDVVKSVKCYIKGSYAKKLWCIGDVVCANFIRYGLKPSFCIIDGKTLRYYEGIKLSDIRKTFSRIVIAKNPAGMVCDEVFKAVRSANDDTLIFIDGEEDLTGFAVVLSRPIGEVLVYGVPPDIGVALSYITLENKIKAAKFLRRFQLVRI